MLRPKIAQCYSIEIPYTTYSACVIKGAVCLVGMSITGSSFCALLVQVSPLQAIGLLRIIYWMRIGGRGI